MPVLRQAAVIVSSNESRKDSAMSAQEGDTRVSGRRRQEAGGVKTRQRSTAKVTRAYLHIELWGICSACIVQILGLCIARICIFRMSRCASASIANIGQLTWTYLLSLSEAQISGLWTAANSLDHITWYQVRGQTQARFKI